MFVSSARLGPEPRVPTPQGRPSTCPPAGRRARPPAALPEQHPRAARTGATASTPRPDGGAPGRSAGVPRRRPPETGSPSLECPGPDAGSTPPMARPRGSPASPSRRRAPRSHGSARFGGRSRPRPLHASARPKRQRPARTGRPDRAPVPSAPGPPPAGAAELGACDDARGSRAPRPAKAGGGSCSTLPCRPRRW
jgi:hypothetical protein